MIFSWPLHQPLPLKRRPLASQDPYIYLADMVQVSNAQGQTGLGECVASRKLADEIAELHLALLETRLTLDLKREQMEIAAMLESLDLEAAKTLVRQGFQTLKFKVGKNPTEEAHALRCIRQSLGDSIAIRLDANRAWNLETAIQFGKNIQDLNIAYLEEPVQNYQDIPTFYRQTQIPVALDETLIECIAPPVLDGVSTYALKPFLMPNLLSIAQCIQHAYDQSLEVAICSAFESPHSLNWLVVLCGLLPRQPLPAGLSTLRWFQGHLVEPVSSTRQALESLCLFQTLQGA
ncbi:MAG: hypothetical protein I8H75_03605 [Myxococcaceae bacterium]|nr:hypothetical protein [Myxococcaceae bacterium]MBH2006413.1 hypothetical protein [Myxococcaceae bacterium]